MKKLSAGLVGLSSLTALQAQAHSEGVLHTLSHGLSPEQGLAMVLVLGIAVAAASARLRPAIQRRINDR